MSDVICTELFYDFRYDEQSLGLMWRVGESRFALQAWPDLIFAEDIVNSEAVGYWLDLRYVDLIQFCNVLKHVSQLRLEGLDLGRRQLDASQFGYVFDVEIHESVSVLKPWLYFHGPSGRRILERPGVSSLGSQTARRAKKTQPRLQPG